MPAAPATKAAIQRALDAVRAAGLTVYSVQITRDGTVTVETERLTDEPKPTNTAKPKSWARR